MHDVGQLLAELEAAYGEDRARTLRVLLGDLDTVSADDGGTEPPG